MSSEPSKKKGNNGDNKSQKGKQKGKKEDLATLKELPEFIEHRLKIYEDLKKKQESERQDKPDVPITVTLPDGKKLPGVAGKTTPMDIALKISKGLADAAIVAKVNGELHDMNVPIDSDCSIELCKFDSPEGKHVFWHSSAHILGQAIEKLYGGLLCTGPALEEGFFYDSFMNERSISPEEYNKIIDMANKIINEKQSFERILVPKEVALEMFKYNPYKSQILREKVPDGSSCSVYKCGTLLDPCRGPHIPNTSRVKGFLITKNSSAYWQGKADNDLLQRVYGVSFPDKKMLKEWQTQQEELAKRDHRTIGKVFSLLISYNNIIICRIKNYFSLVLYLLDLVSFFLMELESITN